MSAPLPVDLEDRSTPLNCVQHVLDLPQLYTKPSAATLLAQLTLLELKPRSWSPTTPRGESNVATASAQVRHIEGLTTYLTRIVASPLGWLRGDDEREQVWEAASLRLAERSGRSAMPAMERSFRVPSDVPGEEIELAIHEPSLTGDNLGLKTWAASYLLARRLCRLDFPSLSNFASSSDASLRALHETYDVLELGSGTGLVGMAAAATLKTGVVLTDLPEIEANLARNVDQNSPELARRGGRAVTAVLDWAKPDVLIPSSPLRRFLTVPLLDTPTLPFPFPLPTPPDSHASTPAQLPVTFPIILAADCIYDPVHAELLADTIAARLARRPDARVVVELPLRTAYARDREELRLRLGLVGLLLLEEGEESGIDDWGSEREGDEGEGGNGQEVRCWWGIWAWKTMR